MRTGVAASIALLLAIAAASAQDYFRFGRFREPAARLASSSSFDGAFNFCRLMYRQVRREMGGQGWWTDYPDADAHFSIRLSELTKVRVSRADDGEPNHLVVRASDAELFQCPFLLISDAGTADFTDPEIAALSAYLLKGGFLWADDFWGTSAWIHWTDELSRILPPPRYPVRDVPLDHPVFRTMFQLKDVPQIPSIAHWRRSGGGTSERGADSDRVNVRGISDEHGRLMVLMTHNTDIADAWEREGEDPAFFYRFSPDGYAVGINVLLYSMTH